MKKFNELTQEEKENAVNFTVNKLKELMAEGIIYSDKEITESQIKTIALEIAEDADYNDEGLTVMNSSMYDC